MRRSLWKLAVALAAIGPAGAGAAQGQDSVPVFWQRLGDTTLTRLLDEALRANQDLRAAAARVRGARAARTLAGLDLVPTVTAGGGFARQRQAGALLPASLGGGGRLPDQSVWDGGFDAFWEVDVFGRLRKALSAEGALATAAQEDLRDLQVVLAAEVARAYFELRGGQSELAVAERNAENQRNSLTVTRQRLDAGRGTAFDTERAQAQLSFTLGSIPAIEAAIALARYRIGTLLGRTPAAVARELSSVAELPELPALDSLGGREAAVRRRPDVIAAERRAAAARALVGSAKADYLPRFTVGGSAGFAATTFDSLGKRGSFHYVVGPSVSWPLLNLGRVKSSVNAAHARADEASAGYEQALLLAEEEVESALVRYRSARERVIRIAEAAASSGRAAELARLRYADGVADFLQVLDAERTQLDAESQLAASRTAAATAYAAVFKALAGGI